jgi:predicted metalloprotease
MSSGVKIGGGAGIIGILIALAVTLLGGGGGNGLGIDIPGLQMPGAATDATGVPPTDDIGQFIDAVMKSVQESWTEAFAADGRTYEQTKAVLFSDGVSTACGNATSAVGPFYCPGDRIVYLDPGFFDELATRFGAPGDFAIAYVIAHELGHHVQTLLGIEPQMRQAQQENPDQANELSVQLELQADCLAGVWAHAAFAEGELEDGDIQEGITAAAAVGDDRLQRQAGQTINQDTWTHGSSEQRVQWFKTGYQKGRLDACNTF